MSQRKITFKLIFLSLICLFITGCDEGLYPIEVSEGFWRAVKDKDINAIEKYSTKDSLTGDELRENILPLDEIILGKTVIDGDGAWVDTTVTISGDKPYTLPIKTVLIRKNKQWKVDYQATMKWVSKGSSVYSVISGIKNMMGELAAGLNQSMEDVQKAIPEIKEEIKRIEESLLEHVPELKKQIEEFVEDLEEAIKELGKESEESSVTET
jgi:methyl-accepting chemotaxis protein